MDERESVNEQGPIVLTDGVCNLCNGFVRFILKHEREPLARFASLQSATAKSLRFGNRLSKRSLVEVEWPSKAIPKGAFKKISDVVNGKDRRVVLSSIEANEPVLGWKITGPGQRASLSALIAEGMKAVTIRVNDVLGVAGFVLPGEHVDIMLTRTEIQEAGDQAPVRKNAFTDVLLQNVRVLAVDQLADDRTEEPTPAKAVTIEVTTEQAQKLMLASSVGQLALALRSAGSTSDEA